MQQMLCRTLIGRDAEMAVITEALQEASERHGGVVCVMAEAGIGKSRLAAEIRALAGSAGFRVLGGRGVQRAAPPPYRPLGEALQTVLGIADGSSGGDSGPDSFDPELVPLRRALSRLLPDGHAEAGEASELAVAEAVTQALGVIGRRSGCLIVLEDLHWADPETLAVLEYLCDHLGDGPRALVLATVRSGEASEAERLVRLLRERRAATVLELERLDAGDTDRMLAACLGTEAPPPVVAEFVRARSDGVPLFVEELLSGLVDSGALAPTGDGWHLNALAQAHLSPSVPLTHVEGVRRRLNGLAPDDRQVLLAAAVLGRRFDWSLLPPITDRDRVSVLDSLRRAAAAGLVEPDDSPAVFRFRHALTRDAVVSDLLPPEHAVIAARALAAVEAAHPELAGEWAALAADLAERAGDRPRAVAALVDVASGALGRGAITSAQAAVDRATALAGADPELSLVVDEVAAHAAALAGDVDGAIGRAASALSALTASGRGGNGGADPGGEDGRHSDADARRARLHLTLARAALVAGRWADAGRHATDALGLTTSGHDGLRSTALALASQVAIAVGRIDEAASLATLAVELGHTSGTPAAQCEAYEVLGRVARPTDLPTAERHFHQASQIAERHDLALWKARALHELGTIDLHYSRDGRRLEAARVAAVEAGAVATIALCDLHLSAIAFADWDASRGIAAGQRCVDLSRRQRLSTLGMGLIHLACCHGQAADVAGMEAVLAEAAALPDEPDVRAGIPGRARMALALRLADFPRARAHLDQAVAILRPYTGLHFPFFGLRALLHTVDSDGADAEQARADARAGPGSGTSFNRVCLVLAEMVARRGAAAEVGDDADDTAEGGTSIDPVVAALRSQGPRASGPWGGILTASVASSALRDGWGGPAGVRWARHALAIFDHAELEELASWCRSLLRDAGAPVPRPRRETGSATVPAGLRAMGVTSREVDVLRLVEAGQSNLDIARRLHLSPRTVERHVSNLLTKTGASDRRALARLVGQSAGPAVSVSRGGA